MNKRIFLIAAVIFFFSNGFPAETMATDGAPPPQPQQAATADDTLQTHLVSLAKSHNEKDQLQLAELLGRQNTLDQLDEPEVRAKSRTSDLRLAIVLKHLQDNASPAAGQTLAFLSKNAVYNGSWQRQELLVRALAKRRPLVSAMLEFLDEQSRADSVNLHVAIETLCENGTESAIKLLSKKMADRTLDSVYKIGWMRGPILVHRRDPILLSAAGTWLQERKLNPDLKIVLAQSLFDYKPHEWYPGREGLPRPPSESATSSEAAGIVHHIGQGILEANYPSAVQTAVRRVLSEIHR